jgi:hypothetical protein
MIDKRNSRLRPTARPSQPLSGHHDGGRDDVGRQHPGDLILGGGQAALHARQSDVRDRCPSACMIEAIMTEIVISTRC